MTMEERLLQMEGTLERQAAQAMVQEAGLMSLLALAGQMLERLKLPPATLNAEWHKRRTELLHAYLEALEAQHPARAARWQQWIDEASKSLPFDY